MIATPRPILRRAQHEDIPAFHEMMADERVMRYWSRPVHDTRAETEDFVAHMMRTNDPQVEEYVIEHHGRCIGKAGCWRAAEIGFLLHPDVWGHGFALEAAQAVIPVCFDKFADVRDITAEIDPRNTASARLLTRLGFRHLRTAEKDFCYGNTWVDTAYYALPRR